MTRLPLLSLLPLAVCSIAATARAEPAASQAAGAAPTAVSATRVAPAPSPPSPARAPYLGTYAPYPQRAPYPGAYAPYPQRTPYPGAYASYPQRTPYPAAQRDRATHAHSARPGENFVARPLGIFGHISLGGPYGVLGGSLNYSFSRYAALEAGVGVGGGGGAEMGAMVLPRVPVSPGFAIGAGFGMSGEFGYQEPFACFMAEDSCTPPKWSFAPFAQGELYVEGRTRSGFSVRGYFGEWRILDTTPDECSEPCTPIDNVSLPYVGVALGGAL